MATGCDNVAWGGVDVELRPPPSAPEGAPDEARIEEAARANAAGPVLLAGVREGSRARLIVVGEVQGDALEAFPDTTSPDDVRRLSRLMAAGSQWILFSEGVRVGTMTADSTGLDQAYCPARATISGVVELVPPAGAAERLLALPAEDARERLYDPFLPMTDSYDQRVASLSLAGEAIPRLEASWPEDGLVEARGDIQAFEMLGGSGTSIATTFVYRDQLAVAPPGQGAYALFILGTQAGDAYREAHVWYRAVDTEGKGAPQYFGQLDWDGDGDPEILLDVFGSNRRWYAGLALRSGQWVRTFQDSCGTGSSSGS